MHQLLSWRRCCSDGSSADLRAILTIALLAAGVLSSSAVFAQTTLHTSGPEEAQPAMAGASDQIQNKVDVEPTAQDADIAGRLQRILVATKWFENPRVDVEEGIVFLDGRTQRKENREWAAALASSTQDVVAVVNRIQVEEQSTWDFSPAWEQLGAMGRRAVQSLPGLVISLIVLSLTWLATIAATRMARRFGARRFKNQLLSEVTARAAAVPVILIGLYLAMQVSGLTQIAATVLGGTGLIGIIIGIAFRDIAENFLASILISMQRPFQAGDLVTIADHQGFVQKVTTRGTIIVTLDGNHVQIPNATIYKSIIRNHSANPHGRLDFIIRIGYDDPIAMAQDIVLKALREHPAVLTDPEPLILVEELTASGVNLHAYFWFNGRDHSGLKVRSATLRQIVAALNEAGITMPDSREVVFPLGVPLLRPSDVKEKGRGDESSTREPSTPAVTRSEGGLRSERKEIRDQARNSRELEPGNNLLKGAEAASH
jgi:small conductance mechanosensitive channel